MDLDGWIGGGQISPAFLSLFDSVSLLVGDVHFSPTHTDTTDCDHDLHPNL